ncbi:Gfo/Idh/MocA family oxidoreductase [Metabacillus litoralis]|uniref:Gfo/Idh/MocA family oxidoreductase n=1 Tax=Metabacillus litoralis TaxID=152268 RepID=A0A5C6VY65_9BACI|nr:Gfo/Idh/MocA family oxidoreductase [Metabacillus litoralis]TXC90481.1 Gfo/Idh/MocA family oxidoreductase [Metabacillus litoralis]
MLNKLTWGILGCADIAVNAFIPAIRQSKFNELKAISSRRIEKAQETARDNNIPVAYGSYEELLQDPEIEAVYIPLPNHLHKEWSMKAAAAGKHVLCEKPIALNAGEAKELASFFHERDLLLGEAFMYRHHPRFDRIKEIVNSGELGTIRGIHGTFTFNNANDKGNIRYRSDWGGGSLYDIGCYVINSARLILEKEPEAATVHGFFSEEHGNVDMMASGLLEFPDSIGVTFMCGMWAEFQNTLQIVGTEGIINIPSSFVCSPEEKSSFSVTIKGEERLEDFPPVNQYTLQLNDFANSVRQKTPLAFEVEDAILNMKVLDACLKSAKEKMKIQIK